jgi:hypothetical protein
MAGGRPKGQQMANLNPYGDLPIYEKPYNTTPQKLKNIEGYNILSKIPNQHKIKMEFDELYNQPLNDELKSFNQKNKLKSLLEKYEKSNATNENKYNLEEKYFEYGKLKKPNKELFNKFLGNSIRVNMYGKNNIEKLYEKDRKNAAIKNTEDRERDRKKAIAIINFYYNRFYERIGEKVTPELFKQLVTAIININFDIKNKNDLFKLIEQIDPRSAWAYQF